MSYEIIEMEYRVIPLFSGQWELFDSAHFLSK